MASNRNEIVDGPSLAELKRVCSHNIFDRVDNNGLPPYVLCFTFENGSVHEAIITGVEARGEDALVLTGKFRERVTAHGERRFDIFYRTRSRQGSVIKLW